MSNRDGLDKWFTQVDNVLGDYSIWLQDYSQRQKDSETNELPFISYVCSASDHTFCHPQSWRCHCICHLTKITIEPSDP